MSYWPIISYFLHSLLPELPTGIFLCSNWKQDKYMLQKPECHLSDLTEKILIDGRKIITSSTAKHFDVDGHIDEWIKIWPVT